jgi:sulfur transfer protein SufE
MVQRINEIIESFSLFDDWEDRYALLIDLGKKLPNFPEDMKMMKIWFADAFPACGWCLWSRRVYSHFRATVTRLL